MTNKKHEIDELKQANTTNRINLWVNALFETERSLLLAERASNWKESEPVKNDIKLNGNNIYNHSDSDPFNMTRTRTFPTLFECDDIISAAYSSAIIYYSQLFNTGYGGDRISPNEEKLRDMLWEKAYIFLETQGIKKEDIIKLNDLVKEVRDSTIAHNDANKIKATFDQNNHIKSYHTAQNFWEPIDKKFWLKVTYKLKNYFMLLALGKEHLI